MIGSKVDVYEQMHVAKNLVLLLLFTQALNVSYQAKLKFLNILINIRPYLFRPLVKSKNENNMKNNIACWSIFFSIDDQKRNIFLSLHVHTT